MHNIENKAVHQMSHEILGLLSTRKSAGSRLESMSFAKEKLA